MSDIQTILVEATDARSLTATMAISVHSYLTHEDRTQVLEKLIVADALFTHGEHELLPDALTESIDMMRDISSLFSQRLAALDGADDIMLSVGVEMLNENWSMDSAIGMYEVG